MAMIVSTDNKNIQRQGIILSIVPLRLDSVSCSIISDDSKGQSSKTLH